MRRILETVVRLPRLIAMGLIRAYQILVSPLLAVQLPLLPVCSQYAIEALDTSRTLPGRVAGDQAYWPLPPLPTRRIRPGPRLDR